MELWQWVLIGLGVVIVLLVIGLVVWRIRRRRQGQNRPVVRTPEQDRLLRVRRIRDRFGGIGGGGLGIHIPYPEVDPRDLRLADWETSARQMAAAEQLAEVNAQVGEELARAARDMKRSQDRAENAFRREADRVREAFQTLGLEAPEIRTRQDLVAAEAQFEQAAARAENAANVTP